MSNFFKSTNHDSSGTERVYSPVTTALKQVVRSTLNKMNLVTREEFAVQTQVLLKTRMRVEQLEKMLMELELR